MQAHHVAGDGGQDGRVHALGLGRRGAPAAGRPVVPLAGGGRAPLAGDRRPLAAGAVQAASTTVSATRSSRATNIGPSVALAVSGRCDHWPCAPARADHVVLTPTCRGRLGAERGRPRMRSAAFSASMIVGALMLPRTSVGITGIHHPQPLDPQHPQLAIHHRPDRAGPDRVIEGVAVALDELQQVRVAVGGRHLQIPAPHQSKGRLGSDLQQQPHRPTEGGPVLLGEIPVHDVRVGRWEQRAQEHLAAAGRAQQGGAEGVGVLGRRARPSSTNITGAAWSCTSGPGRPSTVRTKPPASPMLEVNGPRPWVCSSSRLAGVWALISVSTSVR